MGPGGGHPGLIEKLAPCVTRRGHRLRYSSVESRSDAELYQALAPELVRYATMLVGPTDAHDVVANAVVAAMASPRWADITNRRAYLYRATTTKAQDHIRAATGRRRREEAAARLLSTSWTGEVPPEVVEAVASLSPRQRAVIHLTYWDDLTPSAVAEILGISDGSVRRHLARARAHLRDRLAPPLPPRGGSHPMSQTNGFPRPGDDTDELITRAWGQMVADAPEAPAFELLPWESVGEGAPGPASGRGRWALVGVASVVVVVVIGLGLALRGNGAPTEPDPAITSAPTSSPTSTTPPTTDPADDTIQSVDRTPDSPYLPTWIPAGFDVSKIRWLDGPPELEGPDWSAADQLVLGDSADASTVAVHLDGRRYATSEDLERARWLEDAQMVQLGGPSEALAVGGTVFAYDGVVEPSFQFATFHGTVDDVLVTGFVQGELGPSELARLLSSLTVEDGDGALQLDLDLGGTDLLVLDHREPPRDRISGYELEFTDGATTFTAVFSPGASEASIASGAVARDGERFDGERGTGFFESQPEVAGALGARRLFWWVPTTTVQVWFGGVLSDDDAVRFADSVEATDAAGWHATVEGLSSELIDYGPIVLPEDPQQVLADRLAEQERIGAEGDLADLDVAEIATFVSSVRGGPLPDAVGVSVIGPVEAGQLMAANNFLPETTWHALVAFGLVEGSDDRDRWIEARRAGVRGACCHGNQVTLIEGQPQREAEVVVAHELTHLHDFLVLGAQPKTSQELVPVWGALSEGNATRVMRAYRDERGIDLDLERRSYETDDMPVPVRRLFRFPYLDGETFVAAIAAEGGEPAVDRALLEAPPASSEHILHPDHYLAGDEPIDVAAPDAPTGAVITARGTLGAFMLALAAEDALGWDDAVELVGAWAGDSYVAWSSGGQHCLAAAVTLDDAASARQLAAALGPDASATGSRLAVETCG